MSFGEGPSLSLPFLFKKAFVTSQFQKVPLHNMVEASSHSAYRSLLQN
jgi:hypothetical protein